VFRAIPARTLGATDAFTLVLAYDLLAFGAQAFLGWLVDASGLRRAAAIAGVALAALSLAVSSLDAVATLLLAGTGNAFFHVGAGATVLERCRSRAAPVGMFVAPGALGLAIGLHVGKDAALAAWPLLPLCIASLAVIASIHPSSCEHRDPAESLGRRPSSPGTAALAAVIALCLVSVAVRSFIGFAAPHATPRGTLLLVGLPVAAFCGKLLGGFVADRFGWIRTGVGALVACAPLVAFGGREPLLLLAGLLLFQMTMPVTLVTAAEALPRRPALAFGLPCIALALGALPTFFDAGALLFGSATFLALILLSAAALWQALRLLAPALSRA
jgi:FSR family fosmidomycin resistance protein-like MFS transporter